MATLRTKIIAANNTQALPAARYHLQHHNSLQKGKSKQPGIQALPYVTITKKLRLPEKVIKKIKEESVSQPKTVRKERRLVEPAKVIWKKGHGAIERIDKHTGDISHLVHKAAVYETVFIEDKIASSANTEDTIFISKYRLVRVKVPIKLNKKRPSQILPQATITSTNFEAFEPLMPSTQPPPLA